jgi:hypothetical protein
MKDCTFVNCSKPNVAENVEGLKLENVRVNGKVVEG